MIEYKDGDLVSMIHIKGARVEVDQPHVIHVQPYGSITFSAHEFDHARSRCPKSRLYQPEQMPFEIQAPIGFVQSSFIYAKPEHYNEAINFLKSCVALTIKIQSEAIAMIEQRNNETLKEIGDEDQG